MGVESYKRNATILILVVLLIFLPAVVKEVTLGMESTLKEITPEELNKISEDTISVVKYDKDRNSLVITYMGEDGRTRVKVDNILTHLKDNKITSNLIKTEIAKGETPTAESSFIGRTLWVVISFLIADILALRLTYNASLKQGLLGISDSPPRRETTSTLTLKDVKGHREIKSELEDIVDFMDNPTEYIKLGAKVPKGILLYGPPGTGKTLLAKALAGQANVGFKSVSGSDFIEKFAGVGASRVRTLFEEARKDAPCIIFIDEIDAIGRERRNEDNNENTQTIISLLTEMDGMDENSGVVVIASTNRYDTLDSALKRAGRFDIHLQVSLPDAEDRKEILEYYLIGKPLSKDVNVDDLVKSTPHFSGASLENLVNLSALLTARRRGSEITSDDFHKAIYHLGTKGHMKENSTRSEEETTIVAYHEVGHALISRLLVGQEINRLTIKESTSGVGGALFSIPNKTTLLSKKDIENEIKISYGGRSGERVYLGCDDKVTIGASADIETATKYLYNMIDTYGMSDKLGLIKTSILGGNMGRDSIEKEMRELSSKYYQETLEFIEEHEVLLHSVVNELKKKETLTNEEFDEIVNKHLFEKQDVSKDKQSTSKQSQTELQAVR